MTDYKLTEEYTDERITKEEAEAIGRKYLDDAYGWKGSIRLTIMDKLRYEGRNASLFIITEIRNGAPFLGSRAVTISGITGKIFGEGLDIRDVSPHPGFSSFSGNKSTMLCVTNSKNYTAIYQMTGDPLFEGFYKAVTWISRTQRFIAEKEGGYCNVFDLNGDQMFKNWYKDIENFNYKDYYMVTSDVREGLKNIIREGKDGFLLDKDYRKIDVFYNLSNNGKIQFIACEDAVGKDTLYELMLHKVKRIDTNGHNSFNIFNNLTNLPRVYNFEDPTTGQFNVLEDTDNTMVFKKWVDRITDVVDTSFVVKRDNLYNIVNVKGTASWSDGEFKRFQPILKDNEPWFKQIAWLKYANEWGSMTTNVDGFVAVKRQDGKCNLLKSGAYGVDNVPYIDWVDDIETTGNIIVLVNGGKKYLLISNHKHKEYIECDNVYPGITDGWGTVVCIEKDGKYNFVKSPETNSDSVGELLPVWVDAVDGYDTLLPVVWKDGKCNVVDTRRTDKCYFLFTKKWLDDAEVYDDEANKGVINVVEDGVKKTYDYGKLV